MSDPLKEAYQKGYNAGKHRLDKDLRKEEWEKENRQFAQQVFCAALVGTLQSGGWETGGKKWSNISDYVNGAWKFADAAVKSRRY